MLNTAQKWGRGNSIPSKAGVVEVGVGLMLRAVMEFIPTNSARELGDRHRGAIGAGGQTQRCHLFPVFLQVAGGGRARLPSGLFPLQ